MFEQIRGCFPIALTVNYEGQRRGESVALVSGGVLKMRISSFTKTVAASGVMAMLSASAFAITIGSGVYETSSGVAITGAPAVSGVAHSGAGGLCTTSVTNGVQTVSGTYCTSGTSYVNAPWNVTSGIFYVPVPTAAAGTNFLITITLAANNGNGTWNNTGDI